MDKVLEHHALVPDRLDLAQPLDHLVDGPDRPALAVALEDLVGIAAETLADPACRLADGGVVLADDARRHQRVAERRRITAGGVARVVERALAFADLLDGCEERVVLVRELDGLSRRSRFCAAPDEDRQARTLEAGCVVQGVVRSLEVEAVLA